MRRGQRLQCLVLHAVPPGRASKLLGKGQQQLHTAPWLRTFMGLGLPGSASGVSAECGWRLALGRGCSRARSVEHVRVRGAKRALPQKRPQAREHYFKARAACCCQDCCLWYAQQA